MLSMNGNKRKIVYLPNKSLLAIISKGAEANTCICNATGRNIDLSGVRGVWIDHITWDSSNDPLWCHGTRHTYTIKCATGYELEEA